MSNSDEDYMNLQLDRPLLDKIRTDEQIRRHTLDKRFDKIPVDRALHILLKGDEIQKLSVIQTLPSLLVGDPQTCIQRLMPKMQESLQEASTEFHVAASSTFKTILEQRLVSHSTFTQTFLQSILNSLDSKDQVVADAWLETLLDVIELLPSEVIKREILQVAISKGQLSQPVNSRIICCKLLGKICTRFNSQLIRKQVLPTVHSLCQDVNSDVRACICLQLRFVAEGLGPESVKSALLPSIVELASDEESIVRHASVQTIVYLLPHLNADVIKSTISPLIKKSCDNALKSDVTVMCTIAEEFGKLAIGLEKSLSTSEKTWLIQFFKQLSQVGILPNKDKKPSGSTFNSNNTNSNSSNPGNKQQEFSTINISTSNPTIVEHYVECRRLCAFNIPAMFIFAASTIEDVDDLIATFSELSADPFYLVRRTIACGIHEVAKILGPKNYLIRGELIKLLKDDNEQVLQGLIPELSKTLELLIQSQSVGIEQLESSVVDMGKALLKCENEIFNTNNWRLSKLMLEQLEILPKCFPSDYIYTYFVPVTLNRALNARPMPVKLAAGRTFLVFIRYNLKPVERSELRNKLYSKFARNKSCYIRMLFIRMMIEAMTLYSSMYFKEHFYMVVLSLSEDPIANIRLKLVSLLPTLKSYIRLPSDKKLLSSFESSVRNLMNNEKDRDVISALTTVIRKLDEIDVRHEGQSSSVKLNKQDNDDFKKYEEEKQIMATVSGKLSTGQQVTLIKKSPIAVTGRVNSNDGASSIRNTKQSGISSDNLSKSSISSQKVKQTGSMPLTDSTTFKSRQTTTKSFDLAKASSMPEIPVTLLEDEFLVDTGMRIPAQLSSLSQSTSKIPNLQDIIYRNTRIDNYNVNKSRRSNISSSPCSSISFNNSGVINIDNKGKSKIHYQLPESCLRRTTSVDKSNSIGNIVGNRLSMSFDETTKINKITINDDNNDNDDDDDEENIKSKKYSSKSIIGKRLSSSNRNNSTSNNSTTGESITITGTSKIIDDKKKKLLFVDRDKNFIPSNTNITNITTAATTTTTTTTAGGGGGGGGGDGSGSGSGSGSGTRILDKTKRHSASYSIKFFDSKNYKDKFKRHSLEVPEYSPERGRLKRNYTLDVNHNQGISKIPLRNSILTGSRTAPVTRASSPIRLGPQISFDREKDHQTGNKYHHSDHRVMTRFSSSDEQVDKLCIRFAYVDSYGREENPRKSISKLPVWVPRKKL
ncbi:serine/threonine-protein phosphatase 4 regulatory subunit 4-like isoform X5 [Cotesia glomerata]|uniref:serine/threonine-protein phosphatase 4 regulatory subunit 4-like isoform X5 n=1 Tax=Cotesia glomerata TaxID=32391 RepID=UPI001D002D8C|nr:serine/threonine-protein phosphatase 4 regulatory subunit 4-like isoform X5 [Cotesia glomerata]